MTNEINNGDAMRVQGWDEYVGQHTMKRDLELAINSAVARDARLPHILLAAGAGYGKTTLAQLIARRSGDEFKMVTMPVKPRVLENIVRTWHTGGVLLLDEIHRATQAQQEQLYTLMEDGYIEMANGQKIYNHRICVIGATNEARKLTTPLRDRFELAPHFETYSDGDMSEIVTSMASRLDLECDMDLSLSLGRACNGTPRKAKKLVYAMRDLDANHIEPTLELILEAAHIDMDGLTDEHLVYLRALDTLGGLAGMDKLSNMSGMDNNTLESLESLLIAKKFIMYSSGGRELTQAGTIKVKGNQPVAAGYRRIA